METQARSGRLRIKLGKLWLVAALLPASLFLAQGPGRTSLAAAAAWGLGWLLLLLALARDPGGEALSALRASGADVLLACAAASFLALALLLFPITLVLLFALLVIILGLAAWALVGPSPRLARWLRSWAIMCLAALLLGSAAELVLRLPAVVAITCGHRPGLLRWEAEHYDRLWEHNALRLRSLHLDVSKPRGTARILALGDDATFGALIASTRDTWPYLLEDGLARDGAAVEVVNAGQRGFTTANEAEWLDNFGARFEPDLLIVQLSLNDAVPSYPNYRAEHSFWYFQLQPLLPGLHPYLYSRSYLYSSLDAFKEHQVMRRLHPEGYLPLYEDAFFGWRQMRDGLHGIAAWAHARNVRPLLVLFPDLEPDTVLTPEGYRYAPVHEKIRRTAQAEGMEVLDLFPRFAERGESPESYWPLPCEPLPGPEAQRIAASAIRASVEPWLLHLDLP